MVYNTEGFSTRLRLLREARGFTQEDLAERANMSAHYVGNLEQNIRHPSLNALLRLCAALGTTPNDLFQDSISEDMLQGRCVSVPDDYALRDAYAEVAQALGDWLEPDEYSFYAPPPECDTLIDEAPEPLISLAELLDDESLRDP